MKETVAGILLPFLGTTLGAACVFLFSRTLCAGLRQILTALSAGIMTAASVWSLLVPAMEQAKASGGGVFLPTLTGLLLGFGFMLLLDRCVPMSDDSALSGNAADSGGRQSKLMNLAVTVHNIPEGIAVGAVYAGFLANAGEVTSAGAFALTLGIAIQNFPEGAIISLPAASTGKSRLRGFFEGVLSGIVEPIAAAATVFMAEKAIPILPCLLNFAAAAMLYVVMGELRWDKGEGVRGGAWFAAGFVVMTVLDIALGGR